MVAAGRMQPSRSLVAFGPPARTQHMRHECEVGCASIASAFLLLRLLFAERCRRLGGPQTTQRRRALIARALGGANWRTRLSHLGTAGFVVVGRTRLRAGGALMPHYLIQATHTE